MGIALCFSTFLNTLVFQVFHLKLFLSTSSIPAQNLQSLHNLHHQKHGKPQGCCYRREIAVASERTDLCTYCKAVLSFAHHKYGACEHKRLPDFSQKFASTTFYRVYDDASVSAHQYRMRGDDYRPVSIGFEAGSRGHPPTVSAKKILMRHLNWTNRTPTPFISLYQSPQRALKEARRRSERPWVLFRK